MPSHQYTDLCHGATEHVGAFFRALKLPRPYAPAA
jgi:hypothetical protein